MFSRRLRIGFSGRPPIGTARRHCYVPESTLDSLLNTPGAIDLLLQELGSSAPTPSSKVDGLERLRRTAIHLSVTPTPYYGLALEEILVLCAYESARFDHTAWKRELLKRPTQAQLSAICRRWLSERVDAIATGYALGLPRWPLIGYTPHEKPASASPAGFSVGLVPLADAAVIDRELAALTTDASFAHEHYVACAPATALEYLKRGAHAGRVRRWDPFALDRRLRTLGLGLLLVERDSISIYLSARYQSMPASALGPSL